MSDYREGFPGAIEAHDQRMARAARVFEEALPVVMHNFEIKTDGEFNTVLVQPPMGGFVIKAPDEVAGYNTHKMLDREVAVLELLNYQLVQAGTKLPVAVPDIIADSPMENEYHWAAFTARVGKVLGRRSIWERFTPPEYQSLGRKIGELTIGVSQAVDVATFRRLLQSYDDCVVDREAQFKAVLDELGMFEELGYTNLVRLIKRLGADYHDLQPERNAATPIFIHDDQHENNLGFEEVVDGQIELVEVFDWANAKVGSAARNFRQLAMLHPEAVEAAQETWREETGEIVPSRLVSFWASIQYALSCISCVRHLGAITDYTTQSMQRLHPEIDWQTEFSNAVRLDARPRAEEG